MLVFFAVFVQAIHSVINGINNVGMKYDLSINEKETKFVLIKCYD